MIKIFKKSYHKTIQLTSKHMKRRLVPRDIKDMKIKMIVRHHFTSPIIARISLKNEK